MTGNLPTLFTCAFTVVAAAFLWIKSSARPAPVRVRVEERRRAAE